MPRRRRWETLTIRLKLSPERICLCFMQSFASLTALKQTQFRCRVFCEAHLNDTIAITQCDEMIAADSERTIVLRGNVQEIVLYLCVSMEKADDWRVFALGC